MNQPPEKQQLTANTLPPFEVTTQQMLTLRFQKTGLSDVPDEQLRAMMISSLKTAWQQRQLQQSDMSLLQPAAANNTTGVQGLFFVISVEAIMTWIKYGPKLMSQIISRARQGV